VIVAGEQDAMVSHEDHAIRLHNTVSGSKLNLLPEAGHQLPQTHPAVVIQAIRLVWEMVEAERNGEKEERESRQMEV
jgi:pimeloyl-ACP methyl ester carboxylesterase